MINVTIQSLNNKTISFLNLENLQKIPYSNNSLEYSNYIIDIKSNLSSYNFDSLFLNMSAFTQDFMFLFLSAMLIFSLYFGIKILKKLS